MIRKTMFLLAICILAAGTFGCAGTMYERQVQLQNGGTLTHFGRTGVFGTDGYGGVYEPPHVDAPLAVTLTTKSVRKKKSWESKCGQPSQNKNYRFEEEENVTHEQVLNPIAQSHPVAIGGTNASTGNILLPAAAQAAGIAAAGAFAPGMNINNTNQQRQDQKQKQDQRQKQDQWQRSYNRNDNNNSNINKNSNTNKVKVGVNID